MKSRDAERQPASVPPLFDPDPKRNLAAWVQKCFPDAPNTQQDEAIRLWLGKGSKDRPTAFAGTPARQTVPERSQRQDDINLPDGHRSDDRLAATLQHIAEMVGAALYDKRQQESEDVAIRHPIHLSGSNQVQRKSAADCRETYTTVSAATWREVGSDQIGHSSGNNGEKELTDFAHIAPLGSWGSEPTPYPSSSDGRSNGTSRPPLDPERSNDIRCSTAEGGDDEPTNPPLIAASGSWGYELSQDPGLSGAKWIGRGHCPSGLEQTGSEPSTIPLHSSELHSANEATGIKRLISNTAISTILCAVVLFGSLAIGGKLYRRNWIGSQISAQPASAAPPVKQSRADPTSAPIQTSSSNLAAGPLDTADRASVQDFKVVSDQDRVVVEVRTTGRVVPRVTKLTRPDRLILDLADTTIPPSPRRIDVNASGVKRIRMGTNGLNPPTARVVVDLSAPCEYALVSSSNKLTLQLRPVAQ